MEDLSNPQVPSAILTILGFTDPLGLLAGSTEYEVFAIDLSQVFSFHGVQVLGIILVEYVEVVRLNGFQALAMYQVLSFQVQEVIFEIVVPLDPFTVSKVVFIIQYVRMEYEMEFAVLLLVMSMGTVGFDMAVAMVYFVVVPIICSVVIANWFKVIDVSVAAKDGFIFTVEVSTILISTRLFTQDLDAQDVEVFLFQVKTVFNVHIVLIFSIKDLQRLGVVEVFPFSAETTFNVHIALI